MARTFSFWWEDVDIGSVLDQQAELDFYTASPLKEQSTDRYITPLVPHYPDSEPASQCSSSLFLHAKLPWDLLCTRSGCCVGFL